MVRIGGSPLLVRVLGCRVGSQPQLMVRMAGFPSRGLRQEESAVLAMACATVPWPVSTFALDWHLRGESSQLRIQH